MEIPLINNNEQKHSTVSISNEYTQTDNDQREERPQTTSCLANFSIGMLLFVSLLALTPLIDILGIVYGGTNGVEWNHGKGIWDHFAFYYVLQGITLTCYIQHSFVSLLLPDDTPSTWDEILTYMCCERCCYKLPPTSEDTVEDKVAIREAEITRRGRPGLLLTLHLLLGVLVSGIYTGRGFEFYYQSHVNDFYIFIVSAFV